MTQRSEPKVGCRTPAKGRDGVTNIAAWKFDTLRSAILAELREGDCPWSELTDRVRARLGADELDRMGSLGWFVVTVKLEMEVRGELVRRDEPGPQIIGLAGSIASDPPDAQA